MHLILCVHAAFACSSAPQSNEYGFVHGVQLHCDLDGLAGIAGPRCNGRRLRCRGGACALSFDDYRLWLRRLLHVHARNGLEPMGTLRGGYVPRQGAGGDRRHTLGTRCDGAPGWSRLPLSRRSRGGRAAVPEVSSDGSCSLARLPFWISAACYRFQRVGRSEGASSG